jgi:hypothetical protein
MAKTINDPISKRREDDLFTYRVLITFAILGISLVALSKISSILESTQHPAVSIAGRAQTFFVVFVALAVIFAILAIMNHAKKNASSVYTHISGCAWVLGGISLYIRMWALNKAVEGITALYILLPCLALAYLLYYIYQKECFRLIELITGECVGFWLLKRVFQSRTGTKLELFALIGMALAGVVIFGLLLLTKRKKGTLQLGSYKIQILPAQAAYPPLWIAIAILPIGLILVWFLGSLFALLSMLILIAYLFIMLIYYTIHLV